MDPLSITTSVLTIVTRCFTTITACQNYMAKYSIADLSIAAMCTECSSIRIALRQIQGLIAGDSNSSARGKIGDSLLEDYEAVLGACSLTFDILERRLVALTGMSKENTSSISTKLKYIWNETEMGMIVQHIRGQANAISLLLNAFQSYVNTLLFL
jgi:hypothetical protein